MSIFSGIENANIQRDSEFVLPGRYIFRLDRCSTGKNRHGVEFTMFSLTTLVVVDLEAFESAKEQGLFPTDKPLPSPHKVGDRVVWMIMKTWDGFLSAVKTAIVQMTGCKEEEVTPQNLAVIFGDEQPLAGNLYEFDGRMIRTKKGNPFNRVRVVREISQEELETLTSNAS